MFSLGPLVLVCYELDFVVVPSVKVRVFPENTSCNVAARSQRWISQP